MKKKIILLGLLSSILLLTLFAFFALNAGEHHYSYSNKIYWWFYTPDSLKKAPLVSRNIHYEHSYNIDSQEMRVVITYRNVRDIEVSRRQLLDFIDVAEAFKKYDCSWIYNNPDDVANNYLRYCVYKKGDTLELEFYQKP